MDSQIRHCPSSPEELEAQGDRWLTDRRVAEALDCYLGALAQGAAPSSCLSRRWTAWMLLGEFEQAWRESDRAGRSRQHNTPLNNSVYWDGLPLKGRPVVVQCLHGLGDTIQFLRYAPQLRALCPRVTVRAQPALLELLASAPGIDRLASAWTDGFRPEEDEAEIEVMELPYIFRTTRETVPPTAGLTPAPGRMRRAREFLAGRTGLRVGLVWSASAWDQSRSVPLARLAPLLALPGVDFVSLQFGAQAREWSGLPLADPGTLLEDVASLAALMRSLDLVITVDTMAAHLAGTLGCPTWVLLPHAADWRWMLVSSVTPWYPTLRLWRQPAPGQWQTPVHRMAQTLQELASGDGKPLSVSRHSACLAQV